MLKGIEKIQESSGSDEVKSLWEGIKKKVVEQDNPDRLSFMYRILLEEISKARGVKPPKLKLGMDGVVVEYDSLEEVLRGDN